MIMRENTHKHIVIPTQINTKTKQAVVSSNASLPVSSNTTDLSLLPFCAGLGWSTDTRYKFIGDGLTQMGAVIGHAMYRQVTAGTQSTAYLAHYNGFVAIL
jgi:hypothetical protein